VIGNNEWRNSKKKANAIGLMVRKERIRCVKILQGCMDARKKAMEVVLRAKLVGDVGSRFGSEFCDRSTAAADKKNRR